MMLQILLIAYLILHAVFCMILYYGLRRGIFQFSEQVFPMVALVPIWGFISAVLADSDSRKNKTGSRPMSLEDMHAALGDVRFLRVGDVEKHNSIIPLEEALAINDAETRRKLMLDILHQNPKEYIRLLHEARQDDDIEVTHYASTAIMEVQRDFELKLQKAEREYRLEPENPEKLGMYMERLRRYIDSGLIEERILFIHRQRFSQVLEKIIEQHPEELEPYLYAVRNYLELGNYNKVYGLSDLLVEQWPAEERAWFAKLEIYQKTNDGKALQETIQEIRKRNIYLTPEGRSRLEYWGN